VLTSDWRQYEGGQPIVSKAFKAEQIINTPLDAKMLVDAWRREYNDAVPHGALGYRAPVAEEISPLSIPSNCNSRSGTTIGSRSEVNRQKRRSERSG
jgi:hypothetical protein